LSVWLVHCRKSCGWLQSLRSTYCSTERVDRRSWFLNTRCLIILVLCVISDPYFSFDFTQTLQDRNLLDYSVIRIPTTPFIFEDGRSQDNQPRPILLYCSCTTTVDQLVFSVVQLYALCCTNYVPPEYRLHLRDKVVHQPGSRRLAALARWEKMGSPYKLPKSARYCTVCRI
jgi:hypothetical protein